MTVSHPPCGADVTGCCTGDPVTPGVTPGVSDRHSGSQGMEVHQRALDITMNGSIQMTRTMSFRGNYLKSRDWENNTVLATNSERRKSCHSITDQ